MQQPTVPPGLVSLRRASVLPRNSGWGVVAEASDAELAEPSTAILRQLFEVHCVRSAALAMGGPRLSLAQRHLCLFFFLPSRTLTASPVPSWTLHMVEDGCLEAMTTATQERCNLEAACATCGAAGGRPRQASTLSSNDNGTSLTVSSRGRDVGSCVHLLITDTLRDSGAPQASVTGGRAIHEKGSRRYTPANATAHLRITDGIASVRPG
ncbi:hypothetical protein Q4I30_002245 [Leishmania utingensis]|uniref:Uncharacterized protein n=1 Tax=Leishmania utingensis TaxID=653362 RepID=A0AAW3ATS7_9TRYP